MSAWQLAQLNIAQLAAPIDSPQLADFVANLDAINAMAETAPGFVWRLIEEGQNNATESAHEFGDDVIVNLSLWDSIEALHAFVYKSSHMDIMRQKKRWFNRMLKAHLVLWWVPAGIEPDVSEAHARLNYLQEHGPTQHAFTFRQAFHMPGYEAPPEPG